jgi:hypothetical protein
MDLAVQNRLADDRRSGSIVLKNDFEGVAAQFWFKNHPLAQR